MYGTKDECQEEPLKMIREKPLSKLPINVDSIIYGRKISKRIRTHRFSLNLMKNIN